MLTVALKPLEANKKPADHPSKSPVPVATGALVFVVVVVLEAAWRSLIEAVWTGFSI